MQPMGSVLLLRHGETEWNRAGLQQGREDSPLTEHGRAQALALARFVAARGVGRLLASPLGRAQATAGIIASACAVPVETHPALAEMDFGDCSGRDRASIELAYPGWFARREADRWNQPWPGGESYAGVLDRVQHWRLSQPQWCTVPPTVIVSHRSLGRALLVALGACSPAEALALVQTADQVIEVGSGSGLSIHSLAEISSATGTPGFGPGNKVPGPSRSWDSSIDPG